MIEPLYGPLVEGLRAFSVEAYLQGPDQLVVSRQCGPALPFSGNSFWNTHHEGSWYLGTWAPTCYRVPPEANLIRLCVEFVDHGRQAQPRVPLRLVKKHRLVELTNDEARSLLE